MKRILLSLLGTMLLVCSVNAQVLKGDMNGDGTLTAADVTTLVDHILKGKKEYASSGLTAANSEIQKDWYVSNADYIKFGPVFALYNHATYSKYAYYPALNVIFLYGLDNAVKHTLIVKEKTGTSMTLLHPDGTTKTYYTTCPPALVESITLNAPTTLLYTANTAFGFTGESMTITTSVLPDYADNKEVEWEVVMDISTIRSIGIREKTGNSITIYATSRPDGATIIATAKDGSGVTASVHIETRNRPTVQAVDLGTGVKWASMNVGASAPEDFGKYYSWGETSAYGEAPSAYPASFTGPKNSGFTSLTTKTQYLWSTYKYCEGSDDNITRYNSIPSHGQVDNISTLDLEDDAAHVNMGGNWRMPTREEAIKLENECYWQYVTSYKGKDVNGYIVYKVKNVADKGKVSNSDSNPSLAATYSVSDTHIFLPIAGYHYAGNAFLSFNGSYWTSDTDGQNSYRISISSERLVVGANPRYYGCTIRAVCP